jgi:hypothetical protein
MSSATASFDTYFVILAVITPVSNFVIAAVFSYGAVYSRYRTALGLIALGVVFEGLSQLYWLLLQLQRSYGLALLSREVGRALFPMQAAFVYLGLAVVLAGDVMMVWQLTRRDATQDI